VIKIATSTGSTTVLAGLDTNSTTGADGVATAVQLKFPSGPHMYNGEIYFYDSGSYTIRKITASGNLVTVAGTLGTVGGSDGFGDGGNALGARFLVLGDMDIDPTTGYIYVADKFTVRVIYPSGGNNVIKSIYTSADVNDYVRNLSWMGGYIYFTGDKGYVRKIPALTTSVTGDAVIVAGTGTSGYSGDGVGLLTTPFRFGNMLVYNNKLYINDVTSYVLRFLNFTSGNVERVMGVSGEHAYLPDGTAMTSGTYYLGSSVSGVDPDGTYYWSELNTIRARIRAFR
jgi:hypothetical protein